MSVLMIGTALYLVSSFKRILPSCLFSAWISVVQGWVQNLQKFWVNIGILISFRNLCFL